MKPIGGTQIPPPISGALFHPLFRLYPFQAEFAARCYEGYANLLAADTGVGKSLISMAAMSLLFEDGLIDHVLLECEVNKTWEWQDDLAEHTDLEVVRYTGSPTKRAKIRESLPQVLLSSFETARNDLVSKTQVLNAKKRTVERLVPGPLLTAFADKRVLVIGDEAPAKMGASRTSGMYKAHQMAFDTIRADSGRILMLSATPMDRDPESYFNIGRLLIPESIGTVANFEAEHVQYRDIFGRAVKFRNLVPEHCDYGVTSLKEKMAPVLMVKSKRDPDVVDLFPKMPDPEYTYVRLGKRHQDFYETVADTFDDADLWAERAAWTVLRQIAGHPLSLLRAVQGAQETPNARLPKMASTIVSEVGEAGLRALGAAKLDVLVDKLALLVRGQGAQTVIFPQPISTPILTPTGWSTMGALVPGDHVIGVDGTSILVTGVYDRGEDEVFEILFNDGAKTKATADHPWEVERRVYGNYKTMTVRTDELRGTGGHKDRIPIPAPIVFDSLSLLLPPYTMGAMLGDGTFRESPIIQVLDPEIIDNISNEGVAVSRSTQTSSGKTRYRASLSSGKSGGSPGRNPVIEALRGYGLWGLIGKDKFIPEDYLMGTPEQRWLLLAGLLDTDGGVFFNGIGRTSTEFSSGSRRLAKGVQALVRSLGGLATLWIYTTTAGKPHFRVTIQVPQNPFLLPRKMSRWVKPDRLQRRVKAVTSAGRERVRCIMVDDPRHLYVTEDFIVTHNTFFGQSILPLIEGRLVDEGYTVAINHGQMSAEARGESQQKFRNGKAEIFLSSDAGARGLNLPEAQYVISYEAPLTASKFIQRINRIHRLSSKHESVFALTLVARDTVEDGVVHLGLKRRGWHDDLLEDDEDGSMAINAATRRKLIKIKRSF